LSKVFTSDFLEGPDYLARIAAHHNRLVIGALCAIAMGLFLAVIPLVMYPILRRDNEPLAMGYVVFRGALETVAYIAGATTSLLLVALSRDYVKAGSPDAPQFGTLGRLLVSLGALMFAYLFYQSRLIPRWLSVWGLAAAPLYLADPLLDVFNFSAGILMAPLAVQELVLAVWLIAKGFDTTASQASPALAGMPR
jgi:hypothetical protein